MLPVASAYWAWVLTMRVLGAWLPCVLTMSTGRGADCGLTAYCNQATETQSSPTGNVGTEALDPGHLKSLSR